MALFQWNISRALRLGAICGIAIGACLALDARGWVLGPLSSLVMQTLAGAIGGALLFWIAAVVWNRLTR